MDSVSYWLPDCPYRPQSYTTDFNEGFRSSFIHLFACLLHTDSSLVDKADLQSITEGLLLTEVETLGPRGLSEFRDKWSHSSPWKSSNVIACNTAYIDLMYKHYELVLKQDPSAVLDHSLADVMVYGQSASSGHDIALDEYIIEMMGLVAEFQFDDLQSAMPHLMRLDKVWKKYGVMSSFARGRGATYFANVMGSQFAIISSQVNVSTYCKTLQKPFVTYNTNENFSFSGIKKKFRHVAGLASHFAKIASKAVFSDLKEIAGAEAETAMSVAVGTLKDVLADVPFDEALALNIANSSIEEYVKILTPHAEKFMDKVPACLACFYGNKKEDKAHNPKVGRHDATDSTGETWRINSDDAAMELADLAIELYSKKVNRWFASEHAAPLQQIVDYEIAIDSSSAATKGRAPGKLTSGTSGNLDEVAENKFFEDYFQENKKRLLQAAGLPITLDDDQARAIMLFVLQVGGDMGLFGNFDEGGDLADAQELEDIYGELQEVKTQVGNQTITINDLTLENQRLRREIDMAASTGTVPRTTSKGRYANWDAAESDELLTAVNAKWINLRDAYELVDALNGFNFKYDTDRDSARELLTDDQFSVNLPIGQSLRFPQDVTYVCQSNQEVISAISDVLASLNFKNDEDVRGPRDSKQSQPVRVTTQYNDAALSYVKSVASLSKVFGRAAYSRGKFERKFGLLWQ